MKSTSFILNTLRTLLILATATEATLLAAFPIASQQMAESFSFDGTDYLVGLVDYSATPTAVGARMFTATGTATGSLIETGRTGIAINAAFDGTNHLLVWEDDGLGTLGPETGWNVYGQFISQAGTVVGSPFPITSAGIWVDGMRTLSFAGGVYLVTYTRLINPSLGGQSGNRYVAGRIVNPDGTMGDEIRISTGGGNAANVATDGNGFLVVWKEDVFDTEVRGRFVGINGSLGTEISINASPAPSDNPQAVIFNGQDYLVVWNDEVGGQGSSQWDIFGQFVNPSGTLVGDVITINTDPGTQIPTSVAFDGVNHLIVWIDMQVVMDWQVYGQKVARNGLLEGAKLSISTAVGNQFGGTGFTNGRYLVLINNGVLFDEEGNIVSVLSSEGIFLDATPQIRVELESSTDLGSWQSLPIDPSMIGPDGKLSLPLGEGPNFYRLDIQSSGE